MSIANEHAALMRLQLYSTSAYDCSYLKGQQASSQVVMPIQSVDAHLYGHLVRLGFRRSGLHVYRPACAACQRCIAVRVCVDQFQPSRHQRRAWQRHRDLSVTVDAPWFSPEHYALYQRYQRQRHDSGDLVQDSAKQYKEFLVDSAVDARLVAFYQKEAAPAQADQDACLKMVSIIDVVQDGLSAVYTFYDPDEPQSPQHTTLWDAATNWLSDSDPFRTTLKSPFLKVVFY